jgi:hypothetical protein
MPGSQGVTHGLLDLVGSGVLVTVRVRRLVRVWAWLHGIWLPLHGYSYSQTPLWAGLSSKLPSAMFSGLTAQGVPAATAASISHLPPIGVVFASFLGYNPMQLLLACCCIT